MARGRGLNLRLHGRNDALELKLDWSGLQPSEWAGKKLRQLSTEQEGDAYNGSWPSE